MTISRSENTNKNRRGVREIGAEEPRGYSYAKHPAYLFKDGDMSNRNRFGYPDGIEVRSSFADPTWWDKCKGYVIAFILTTLILGTILFSCRRGDKVYASEIQQLKASWYSSASLKAEGTWKTSKGVMSNGNQFDEKKLSCATRLYPLGSFVRVVCLSNGHSVVVKVTDRIGKRFAETRIDLSKTAFEKLANLKEGLINITVEVI